MMEQKDRKITDLHNLIASLHKGASESTTNDLVKHSMRILNSLIGSTTPQDLSVVKQKTMEKMCKLYPSDTKAQVKAQELMQKISKSRTLTRKAEAIKLLLKLSELNPGVADSFDSMFKSKALQTQQTRLHTTESNFTTTQQWNTQRRPLPDQLLSIRNRGSSQQNISQTDILREITFVMQNISGNLITFEKDMYSLKSNVNVSEPVRKIVRELCDIGWLFKKITSKVEQEGTVRDAFNIAIREELNQYYRWIALIQNMAKSQQLTLRKLMLWSFEPFQRLKWLAIISQAINPFQGCKIISILNSYRPQGNTAINQLLNRLLNHVIQPLLKFIFLWVNRGELSDPYNQYFIFDDPAPTMPRLWQDKYKIIWDMIPNLIDQQSALMIFNTGKTINFLKKCCNHEYHIDVDFLDSKQLFRLDSSNCFFPEEFKHWLRLVSDRTHKQLMDVLFNKFKLKMHLDAVKRFLLMGQGQFIRDLLQGLGRQLDKPISMMQQINMNLQSTIEMAVRSSNAQYLSQDVLQKLSFKFLDQQGSEGWSIFSLDYKIDAPPLNALLSPDAMRSYRRIFNFLCKVKRIDLALNQLWLAHAKQSGKSKQERRIFHSCNLLRHAMAHFVNNIYSYIMVAIESAWQHFMIDLDKAGNFDEVIAMHDQFLGSLLQITFQTGGSKPIHSSLLCVFELITRFKINQDRLLEEYRTYNQKMREYNNRKKAMTKNYIIKQQLALPMLETEAGKKVKDLKQLYDKAFRNLSNLIKQNEEKLVFLNFRLDFNEYYQLLSVTNKQM